MNLEQLDQANKIILKLADYLNQQRKELDALRQSLEDYQEFMTQEIKRLRDES